MYNESKIVIPPKRVKKFTFSKTLKELLKERDKAYKLWKKFPDNLNKKIKYNLLNNKGKK